MRNETLMFVAGALIATCTTVGAYAQGGQTCAAAEIISDGVNAYNNAGATVDMDYTGLCDMGQFGTETNFNTVWFQWTATTTDTYTFSTCGTAGGVDTRLSAQTGCDASTVVACNDDGTGCAGFSSLMTLSASAGTVYYIAVGVFEADTTGGAGTMSISVGGGGGGNCPAGEIEDCNTNCCPAIWVGDGLCDDGTYQWNGVAIFLNCDEFGNDGGDCGGGGGSCGSGGDCCVPNLGTTGCIDTECCTTVCNSDPFCCTTEWDQLCANEAATLCPACGAGSCTIPPGVTPEEEVCGDDTNGGCNAGGANQALSSLNTSIGGTFYTSTTLRDIDWYGFTVTAGTEITLNLFSNLPSFCAIVDNPGCTIIASSTGSCPSTMTACIGPGSYYIVAAPSQFIDLPCGTALGNNYTLQISSIACSFVPPAGDDCSAPMVAVVGSNDFTNINAGTSFGEVTCGLGGAAFTKDVFFSFVAPATDGYTFATCGSSAEFDTGIEVWDGCPDAGGFQLACNDDCPESTFFFASRVSANLTAGTTYIIRVGGWQGATGTTELLVSQGAPVGPPNDNCADATVAIVGNNPFDTNGSTTDGPNPTDVSCGASGSSFFNDVWFTFTAPAAGIYTVSLCSAATWDTRLDIYDGCGGTIVVCNDDFCVLTSEVTLAATAGTSYRIRIGGWGATNFGVGDMVISDGGGGGGGGAGLTCAESVVLPMGATAFNRAGATLDLDYTGLCDMGAVGTEINYNCIFYKFTPTQAGLYTFSTCNAANHDTRLSAQTSCDPSSVIACNDDGTGCTGFSSIMDVTLSCGIEYTIALGGYLATTPTGTGTLTVTVASPVNCSPVCVGDFNNDQVRNASDLAYVLSAWGTPGGDCNNDGLTNGADLAYLFSGWGNCPQ